MLDLLELPGRPPIEESGSSRWATGCGAPGRLPPSVLFRSRYCSAACATARILEQTPGKGFICQSLNQADGGIRRRAAGRSPTGLPGEINVARFVVRPIQQLSPLTSAAGSPEPSGSSDLPQFQQPVGWGDSCPVAFFSLGSAVEHSPPPLGLPHQRPTFSTSRLTRNGHYRISSPRAFTYLLDMIP